MVDEAGAEGRGTLSLTFAFPPAAFLYRQTRPRLQVDGVDVPVPGWGRLRVSVEAGRRTVQIWVPYALVGRAGKARTEVTVPPGGDVPLEYMAPTITVGRGSLGPPGEQKSRGYSAVMVMNVVALVAVVTLLAIAIAVR
jgi:hypothetical protein